MLQRTRGSALLLMLVVTGFASQVPHPTLSNKERRELTHQLKTSKTLLLQEVATLSNKQLHYQSTQFKTSIYQLLQQSMAREAALWKDVEQCTQTSQKGFQNVYADEIILADTVFYLSPVVKCKPSSAEENITAFKKRRKQMILFTNTTTDNIRNYFVQTPAGTMDAYQAMLLLCNQSAQLTQRIAAIKHEKGFLKY